MMKTLTQRLAVACLGMLSLCACQQNKFTVEGTITGAQDSTLYLIHVALSGPEVIDSVQLGANGQFAFSEEAPEAPEFYVLRVADQIINLSIDSTETVTVTAQWPGMASRYEVEGSDNCQQIRTLSLMQQDLQRHVMALQRNRSLMPQQRADSIEHLLTNYKEVVKRDFIFHAPNEAYSYFALFQTLGPWLIFNPRDSREDMRVAAAVATCWDTFHPGTERAQHLHNLAIEGLRTQRILDAREAPVVVDSTRVITSGIIDLQLPDAQGRQRTLSELQGKVVLLDFHLFAARESTARILLLRELYNKYHARGLEIYQVALDEDEHFWKQLTAALPWVCVRDDSGSSASTYNVQQLPEFFLIDRESNLQKRSSQISDVEREIERLL